MNTPRWSRWWLARVVPAERLDDVLGDGEELHARRREQFGDTALGKLRLTLATLLDTVLLVAVFLGERIRRREWGFPGVSAAELRLGLRLMRKQPLMAATAILALAVGIAVATTGFTLLDAFLGGELPVPSGDRYVRLEAKTLRSSRAMPLDLERYRAVQSAQSFEHFGAFDRVDLNLLDPSGQVESLVGVWITPSSFRHLPYAPRLGRGLLPSDGLAGAPPVVVLRESLWQRRYGGRLDMVGQKINLDGQELEVVGVLGDDAGFPKGGEVWLSLDEQTLGGSEREPRRGLTYFGILSEETSLTLASEEVRLIGERFGTLQVAAEEVAAGEAPRLTLLPFIEVKLEQSLMGAMLITVLVLLLLVIAANIANLVLARNAARRGELAVRTALGAPRARLVGQLAVEVALLAVVAAGLGVVASRFSLRWLEAQLDEAPFWLDLTTKPKTLLFVVGITVLASAVGGLLPALKATRRDPIATLQTTGRGAGSLGLGRGGAAMMVAEMALSVALLSGALVMARGLAGYSNPQLDLPKGEVLTARILAPSQPEAAVDQPVPLEQHLPQRTAVALAELPGVTTVGIGNPLPLWDAPLQPVEVAAEVGEPPPTTRQAPVASVRPGFLETFTDKALQGRLFDTADLHPEALPVAVVNEPFVAKFLGGRNPIGRRVRVVTPDTTTTPHWREIVGVVPDLGLSAANPELAAGFYIPWSTNADHFYVALRTQGDPRLLAAPLRQAMAGIDPAIRVSRVLPLEEVNTGERTTMTGFITLLSTVGGLVLLLSLVGLYAMTSFAVTRRTREIGIRLALGANHRQIVRTVVGGTARFLTGSVLLGALLGAGFLQLQDTLFYTRLPSTEPWILPAVAALLITAGVIACWVPVTRALRIVPTETLRYD